VDIGMICFDFDEEGGYTWNPLCANFADLKVLSESI